MSVKTGQLGVPRNWHLRRATQERRLATLTADATAKAVHQSLADLHQKAATDGYRLQVVEDR
ncbi:hypothetical protein [Sphingomonas sp. 1P08PE]|uniref:hypothetical protein n=1 Tax=Sphingomonas sp. 1P08PE TaxID=554122 RepID=UPI00399F2847